MCDFYLFEAGATKTTLLKVLEERTEEVQLPAFNANRDFSEFKESLSELDLRNEIPVFFYGAGCAAEVNKEKVRNLFTEHKIEVYDDILAAARAAYGQLNGIVCILGTGGLSAHFDGSKVIDRRGGYGYLLGDLGG